MLCIIIVMISVLCIGSSVFAGTYTKSFKYALKNVNPLLGDSYGVTEILSVQNVGGTTVPRTLTCNLTVIRNSDSRSYSNNQCVPFSRDANGYIEVQKLTSKRYNGTTSITTKHYFDMNDTVNSTGGEATYYGAANTGTVTMNVC